MVAFGLVRIHLGKRGNGLVEHIPVTQVAANLCRVAGARTRASPGRARGYFIYFSILFFK